LGRCSVLAIFALLVVLSLSACSVQTVGEAGEGIDVRVVATEDFGARALLNEEIRVPSGTSAMEALLRIAEVETRYGGGFVNAINGVRSQFPTKDDWFIYVNGISINKGAGEYTLRDGDVVQFDLHDWHFRMFIPAIIGGFPASLLRGYEGQVRPTVIVYGEGLRDSAERLRNGLGELGLTEVSIQSVDNLSKSDKQRSNLAVIATEECSLVSELNRAWDRLGFFVHIEDGIMAVYDSTGESITEYEAGSGVIQSTQSPWNPKGIGVCENVVWMISGTDEAGVRSAVDALIDQHESFQFAFAAVIAEGQAIRVPQ
jgi:hypothetical protein